MSPTPGRSTLITSAPNQASNCVQVGPDWTWVKSRMRTPVSALLIILNSMSQYVPAVREGTEAGHRPRACRIGLFLFQSALRIEVAYPAALGTRRRIDDRVDQRRLAGIHGRVDRAFQFVGRRRVDADTAERLHHLVVTRALEDHDADRQAIAADRLDLHAGESERAVALDHEHRFAGLDARRNCRTHADA